MEENIKKKKSTRKNSVMNSEKNVKDNNKKVLNLHEEIEKLNQGNLYEEILNRISNDITSIDEYNFDAKKAYSIENELDLELAKVSESMSSTIAPDELNKIEDFITALGNQKKRLLLKSIYDKPLQKFIYLSDEAKEEILQKFFVDINKEVHWLEIESTNFTSSSEQAISEKNEAIVNSLLDVLEDRLSIVFSNFQKHLLKKDFLKVTNKIHGEYDRLMEECQNIKVVSEAKLSTNPSYKRFINKTVLKKYDISNRIATLRLNFLNFIGLTEKQRKQQISEQLVLHMKTVKDIIESEHNVRKNHQKVLIALIILGGMLATAAPTAGALSIITVGSAMLYTQMQNLILESKARKVEQEMINLENMNSDLINDTFEKMEIMANELLEEPLYENVAELYKKKKRNMLTNSELKRKVENCIILATIEYLNELNEQEKIEIINKVNDNDMERKKENEPDIKKKIKKKNEIKIDNKEKGREELEFNIELEL